MSDAGSSTGGGGLVVVDSTGAALFSTERVLASQTGYIYDNNPSQLPTVVYDIVAGSWSISTQLANGPQVGYAQTRLHTGAVLQAGGLGRFPPPGDEDYIPALKTAYLFSPASLTFTPTGNMSSPHAYHTLVTTFNGTALALGGMSLSYAADGGQPDGKLSIATDVIDAFNPFTRTWSVAGTMQTLRTSHVSVVLADGQVLTTGGYDMRGSIRPRPVATAASEVFNPLTGVSTLTGSLSEPRIDHAMVLLADGRVLACGGRDIGGNDPMGSYRTANLFTCELFNSSTGLWELTGNLTSRLTQGGGQPVPWVGLSLFLLPSGQVLASTNGPGGGSFSTCVQQFNLFSPQTGTWSETGPIPASSGLQILLPTGKLLLALAYTSVAQCQNSTDFPGPPTGVLYNPATGVSTVTGGLPASANTVTHPLLF